MQEDDLCIIIASSTYDSIAPDVITAGWDLLFNRLYTAGVHDYWVTIHYKWMGTTPDTSVTMQGTNRSTCDSAIAYALRGVDLATPFDVATVSTAGQSSPNPAAITTVTNGAMVIATQGQRSIAPTTATGPTGYSNFEKHIQYDTYNNALVAANKIVGTAGSEDPGVFPDWGTSSTAYVTATLAVRPSVSSVEEAFDTDFSEYTTGVNLSDWTDLFSNSLAFTAEDNSGLVDSVGTKYLELVTTATASNILVWDDFSTAEKADILCGFSMTPSTNGFRIFARLSGTEGSEDGYFLNIKNTTISIDKITSGVESTVSSLAFTQTSDEYWVRFQVDGTALKAKIWIKSALEPSDWTIETTDTSFTDGLIGLSVPGITETVYIDYFAANTVTGSADLTFPTYPPEDFELTSIATTTIPLGETLSLSSVLGHVIPSCPSGHQFTGARIYCANHSDDVRVGVYQGGTISDPSGATLLKDLGLTSGSVVDDWVEISFTPAVAVPDSTPLWFIVKGDNVSGFQLVRKADPAHHGDMKRADGAYGLDNHLSIDPDVAFVATLPSAAVSSTGSNYYKMELIIEPFGTLPETSSLVFVVQS